jgi:4'-phosphopantetheinyl transferase
MAASRRLVTWCQGPDTALILPPDTAPLLDAGVITVWYAPLNKLHPRLEELASGLDVKERERAVRFRFDRDRERYIIGHGVLRELIGRYMDLPPDRVHMERGEFGKPFLPGTPLHFNLSDTKDAVLVAFHPHLEIGADIETMHRDTDHERVSAHYFTPEEVTDIASASDGKRRFLELWTRKEAVLKASGVGIMDDLKALRVDGKRNEMTITHADFARLAAPSYHVSTFHVGADHVISTAAPSGTDVQVLDASAL